MTETDIEGARRSLGWWLRQTSTGLLQDDGLRPRRPGLGERIEETLLALRDDGTELPRTLRGLLGPLRPASYGAAVRLLLWARDAPNGPRCRSYRAALYLVQRLDASDVEQTVGVRRAST